MTTNISSTNRSRRRVAIVASAALLFGVAVSACGEDVVDDDVEREIKEIDDSINDFVDTVFSDTTNP